MTRYVAPPNKLQHRFGGTLANGGNFEIFGLKFLFIGLVGSKSLSQSHYCHLSQRVFKSFHYN